MRVCAQYLLLNHITFPFPSTTVLKMVRTASRLVPLVAAMKMKMMLAGHWVWVVVHSWMLFVAMRCCVVLPMLRVMAMEIARRVTLGWMGARASWVEMEMWGSMPSWWRVWG